MGLLDACCSGGVIGAKALSLVKGYVDKHGGIDEVVAEMEKTGYGAQVKSWVGTGAHLPIDAEDIEKALGSENSRNWPASTGLPIDKAAEYLAQHLPTAIDKATPDTSCRQRLPKIKAAPRKRRNAAWRSGAFLVQVIELARRPKAAGAQFPASLARKRLFLYVPCRTEPAPLGSWAPRGATTPRVRRVEARLKAVFRIFVWRSVSRRRRRAAGRGAIRG